MHSKPAILLLSLFGLAGPAIHGAPVEIVVDPSVPIELGTTVAGVVEVTPVDEGADENLRSFEQPLGLPGKVSIDLEPGKVWRLTYRAAGYWSEPRTITPSPPGDAVLLTAWPTGTIRGMVTVPRGESLPEELTVRFEPSPETPAERQIPRTIVSCPVEDGHWSCEIPALRSDLRLRATGFVSHYFWDLEMAAGKTRQLGNLRLRRGASLVGWVAALEGPLSPDCTVRLAPMESGRARSQADKQRLDQLAMLEKPTKRGFFHFNAMPPGSYMVSAEQPGSAQARIFPVTVMENAETELRSPLELTPPLTLEVVLTPPLDISQRPWKLEVLQLSAIPGNVDAVFDGTASEEGRFVQEGLQPARYAVMVHSPAGDQIATEVFELTPGASTLELALPLVMVEGTLSLDDEPLSAELLFGGPFGIQRTTLVSDEDGEFFGMLPRDGEWLVHVEAEEPRIRRNLTVEVEPEDGVARVDIELPMTRLSGEVVDAEGLAVAGALVKVIDPRLAEEVTQISDDDGRFLFEALAEGSNVVWAGHVEAGRSPEVTVDLVEKLDPNLRLTLRPTRTISGKVVSPAGPVPGAMVATRSYGGPGRAPFFNETPSTTTNVAGEFELEVQENARRVQIVAYPPGYALAALPVTGIPEEPVVISVEQVTGTVVFELDEPFKWLEKWKPRPGLWIDGVPLDRFVLQQWAAVNSVDNHAKTEYRVPALPTGRVTACWTEPTPETYTAAPSPQSGHCQGGFLGPSGELRFQFKGDDRD